MTTSVASRASVRSSTTLSSERRVLVLVLGNHVGEQDLCSRTVILDGGQLADDLGAHGKSGVVEEQRATRSTPLAVDMNMNDGTMTPSPVFLVTCVRLSGIISNRPKSGKRRNHRN
jgi:hypothetical protein